MNKKEIELIHNYLVQMGVIPIIIVTFGIGIILKEFFYIGIFLYFIMFFLYDIMFFLYDIFVQDSEYLFIYTGYYWEENDSIFIQIGKKIHKVDHVEEFYGEEEKLLLHKCAFLFIRTPDEKIKIHGKTLYNNTKFSNSDLMPLYERLEEMYSKQHQEVI